MRAREKVREMKPILLKISKRYFQEESHWKGLTIHSSLSMEQAPRIQTEATIATSSRYADMLHQISPNLYTPIGIRGI